MFTAYSSGSTSVSLVRSFDSPKIQLKLKLALTLKGKGRFPLPELTARVDWVDGCQKNAPEFSGRQLGPWTRAVNSGSGNRP